MEWEPPPRTPARRPARRPAARRPPRGHHRDGYRDASAAGARFSVRARAARADAEDEAAFQLKTLVLRIGDFHARKVAVEEEDNLEDNITGFAQAVNAKGEGAGLVKILKEYVECLPLQGPVYATLGAVLNAEDAALGALLVEQTCASLAERLAAGDGLKAKLVLKFLAELCNCGVVAAAGERELCARLRAPLARVAGDAGARTTAARKDLSVYLVPRASRAAPPNCSTTPTARRAPRRVRRARRGARGRRRARRRLPRAQLRRLWNEDSAAAAAARATRSTRCGRCSSRRPRGASPCGSTR